MPHFAPSPDTIIKERATGLANMAVISQDLPAPMFGLQTPFVLVAFLAWFTGGSGSATLFLKQRIAEHRAGQDESGAKTATYDQDRRRFLLAGTGDVDFIDFRVQADEMHHWVFGAGDMIVPVWTNPNTQVWTVEVQLAAVGV